MPVEACNEDALPLKRRQTAKTLIEPYPQIAISKPSSALGPGYASAVKPDLLMPGSRERLMVIANHQAHIDVKPAGPSRAAGLKVAAPPHAGHEHPDGYTSGQRAAAALAYRNHPRLPQALATPHGSKFPELP